MLRSLGFALVLGAASAAWAEEGRWTRPDPFVVSGDACGASRFSHLVGAPVAELHQAGLPANANVLGQGGRLTTLEYEPARLNVVVNGAGRVVAIGCF